MPVTRKSKSSKPTTDNVHESIVSAYIEHLLTKGSKPVSVYELSHQLKIEEQEFYAHFSSFESLEKQIWADFVLSTLHALKASAEYDSYPIREKLLAFYFTFVEVLGKHRSFILVNSKSAPEMLRNNTLSKAREVFMEYAATLIAEGVESGEIVKRMFVVDQYPEALWLQLLFVLRFWIKDESAGFENTDAAIEKAVKVSFDLMGPGALDSILDLARFMFRNK